MTIWPPSRLARQIGQGVLTVFALIALSPYIVTNCVVGWWRSKTAPAEGADWQRWYAWFPTFLYHPTGDDLVWLEPIERRVWKDILWCRRVGDTTTRFPWNYGDSPEEG